MLKQYAETLYDAYGQAFQVDKVHFENKTKHQHLLIFQNAMFGRVMALDGIIQTTEADEFIYHEMLTHVPLLAHGAAKQVLIIGGGDGGMLREVCKYSTVEQITLVEIDNEVVEMCKTYLPKHSAGAYDDPRVEVVIADGATFVKESNKHFDVIICDSTDPIGPATVLFTEDFYYNCKKCLNSNGILVTQNGVAYMQLSEVINTAKRMPPHFKHTAFYTAAVPTYVGGVMTFAWGTNNPEACNVPLETLEARYQAANITTRYYNPPLHQASFCLPQYIINALEAV